MEVAVLGDTHVPSRAERIPEWVRRQVRTADHAIHAGDFDAVGTYERVASLAGPGNLTAVRGNVDPPGVDAPAVAEVTLGGVTFVVTHGNRARGRAYEDALAEVVEGYGGDVGVAGHTHELLDVERDGLRLLNPGSATGVGTDEGPTTMTVSVADGECSVAVERPPD